MFSRYDKIEFNYWFKFWSKNMEMLSTPYAHVLRSPGHRDNYLCLDTTCMSFVSICLTDVKLLFIGRPKRETRATSKKYGNVFDFDESLGGNKLNAEFD